MKIPHIPVLLNEVNQAFEKLNSGYFLDCTLG
ncbi:16S rRNA (cytosine(1402)-N(4))-methyltransferase, partial [Campylobacter coli]|nr:16S rRNA (cytosine(1402)-N(4))-methyltransferase [Campylobacter coli]